MLDTYTYQRASLSDLNAKAHQFNQEERWDDSLACCNAILAKTNRDAEVYAIRANAKRMLRQYHNAIEDCDVALKLNSNCVMALEVRAASYWSVFYENEVVYLKEVEQTAKRLLAINENNFKGYFFLGQVRLHGEKLNKNQENALWYFARCIEIEPDNFFGWLQLARTNFALDRYAEAVSYFKNALQLLPMGSVHIKSAKESIEKCHTMMAQQNRDRELREKYRAEELQKQRRMAEAKQKAEQEAELQKAQVASEEHYKNNGCAAYFVPPGVIAADSSDASAPPDPQASASHPGLTPPPSLVTPPLSQGSFINAPLVRTVFTPSPSDNSNANVSDQSFASLFKKK